MIQVIESSLIMGLVGSKHQRKTKRELTEMKTVTINLMMNPIFKNAKKGESHVSWIYQSYFEGGWWFMSPEANEHVENLFLAHRRGELTSEMNHYKPGGKCDFVYNFVSMVQENLVNGTRRKIRRMEPHDLNMWYNDYINDMLNSDREHIWFYQCNNSFRPYLKEDQDVINDQYRRKKLVFVLRSQNSLLYEIDLKSHSQTAIHNVNKARTRKARKARKIIKVLRDDLINALLTSDAQETIMRGVGKVSLKVDKGLNLVQRG